MQRQHLWDFRARRKDNGQLIVGNLQVSQGGFYEIRQFKQLEDRDIVERHPVEMETIGMSTGEVCHKTHNAIFEFDLIDITAYSVLRDLVIVDGPSLIYWSTMHRSFVIAYRTDESSTEIMTLPDLLKLEIRQFRLVGNKFENESTFQYIQKGLL